MKIPCLLPGLVILFTACTSPLQDQFFSDPVELVNPLMGTDSEFSLSNGNIYPAIARPWGMNFWAPQTNKMGNGWFYHYDAFRLRGFKQTHQPSPWINDYGQFSVFATTGKPVFKEDERASWFSHKTETVKPYLYEVYLADHDIEAAFTATGRAAFFQFTFPENNSSCILIDALDGGSSVNIKTLTIEAPGAEKSPYIQKVTFRNKPWNKSWFTHNDLLRGGVIHFEMDDKPNKKLWNTPESFPSSITPFKNLVLNCKNLMYGISDKTKNIQ